jgi:hypothetical protein
MKKQWVLVGILAGALCASEASAQHQAPKDQPTTAPEPAAPTAGAMSLGTVRIPRAVTADGKPLRPGSYQVRLTEDAPRTDAVGISDNLFRWAEFVQGGTVRGREVVNIVPNAEVKMVVKDAPPAAGGSKVQMLRGNEYLRVWINRGGNHYLIHLPAGGGATGQ